MEHRAIPNLGKEGDITPTQTTGRGAGQDSQVQQAAGGKGSMAKAPIGHIGLLSELGRGVCAWESEQQSKASLRCPFMGG